MVCAQQCDYNNKQFIRVEEVNFGLIQVVNFFFNFMYLYILLIGLVCSASRCKYVRVKSLTIDRKLTL